MTAVSPLDEYYLTNYTKCVPMPYFDSQDFFETVMNYLTAPSIVFGIYGIIMIVVASRDNMKSAKWVLLNHQVSSFWCGSLACYLVRPYIHFPTPARYYSGLLLLVDWFPFKLLNFLGLVSQPIEAISRAMIFENRYSKINMNKKYVMGRKLRFLFFSAHYILFLAIYMYHVFYSIVDDVSAKMEILKKVPCPDKTFFHKNCRVMAYTVTQDLWIIAFQSHYLFGLSFFLAILCGFCLWTTTSHLSQATRKMQQRFFIALTLQTLIPFSVMYIPTVLYWAVSAMGIPFNSTGRLTIICIVLHSILGSILLVVLHRPHWEYTMKLLCCRQTNVGTNVFVTSTAPLKRTSRI